MAKERKLNGDQVVIASLKNEVARLKFFVASQSELLKEASQKATEQEKRIAFLEEQNQKLHVWNEELLAFIQEEYLGDKI